MTHQPNTAKTALVSTTNVWLPITAETPTGMKCLVIDKAQGIAYLREYWPGHGWTHYFPLPRLWAYEHQKEIEANAHLIAAAPDLLEAAIALQVAAPLGQSEWNAAADKLDKAISKATGVSSDQR